MTVQIDKDQLKEMIQANMAFNQAMATILSSLDNAETWLSPADAEKATGVPAQTVRHLARNNKIQSRKKSKKLIEVLLSDLQHHMKGAER